jgi:ribosomal protein S6
VKCFLKAGFPAHASADTQDITVENLQAISDLCKQRNLPDNAEYVVIFDNELATTEDIQSAADIAAKNSRCEVMEEMDDDEGIEWELKIRTFGEALYVVSDQEFTASKNVPELLELMQDAKEIIQHSLVKKSRQYTLKDMWGQRN